MTKTLLAACCLVLWMTTPSMSEHALPDMPEGGLMVLGSGECTDEIYHEEGQCTLSRDMAGNLYAIFAQNGEIKVIRQIIDDGFIELYIDDGYGTF
jgi:hypothetical protein